MKRLFTALKIQPDAEFLAKYRKLRQDLRLEQIKWVEEQNIHITLKFFGETSESDIPGISSVLNHRASQTPVVQLRLSGLGIFGSAYSPKVIWAGIEPYEEISRLMKSVHTDLAAIGFEPDRQNLVPHLTLGRIKFVADKTLFRRAIDLNKTVSSELLTIREIILYESILRREGPLYNSLRTFPLQKKLP
jgi:2'-5' RNA ligase